MLSTANLKFKDSNVGAAKWRPWWVGPLEVVGQKATTVELQLPPAWKQMFPKFHVGLLKAYQGDAGAITQRLPELDAEGAEIFEVGKIEGMRWNKSRKRAEWRIRWKGYGDADNTWEPAKSLVGADKLLAEFRPIHGDPTPPSKVV